MCHSLCMCFFFFLVLSLNLFALFYYSFVVVCLFELSGFWEERKNRYGFGCLGRWN